MSKKLAQRALVAGFCFVFAGVVGCKKDDDETAATCTDGVRNGDEAGVDCGGACPDECATPACDDGVHNGDETGVDCGGACQTDCCENGYRDANLGELGVDCGGSCEANCYTGTIYYVANDGDDANPGTDEASPWQTIDRVNSATLEAGDAVLFKRGDVWYEALSITWSGTSAEPIYFSNYGTGSLPRICGSIALKSWTNVGGNIWESVEETSDPSLGVNHDGSERGATGYPGGAWFENLDGSVSWGHQEKVINAAGDYSELTEAYDWGWHGDHIYVYSTTDPGQAYGAVQVSQRQFAVGMENNNPQEHIVIDGLALLYTQSKGYYDGYPASAARDLTIRNCHVGYVGIKEAASAYCLAVWHSDLYVQNNEIHDCGRRGVSYNIYGDRGVTFENVLIENNHFHHGFHTTGVDIAHHGVDPFTNFTIRGNLFEGDPSVDLDNELLGIENFISHHIFTYGSDTTGVHSDFYFYNNVFTYCHGRCIHADGLDDSYIFNNTFYGVNPTHVSFDAQLYFTGNITNMAVKNNIFYNDADPAINAQYYCIKGNDHHVSELDVDYNLHFTPHGGARIVNVIEIDSWGTGDWAQYQTETGWDTNSPSPGDPLFVDSAQGDFHLQGGDPGSPAIGAGEAASWLQLDREGTPYADPPSVGAYEYTE